MNLGNAYFPNKDYSKRNENEYYPTPAIATYSLLKNHSIPHKIWEPAAGRGHISKELIRNGHEVVSTDLFEYNEPFVDVTTGIDFLKAHKMDVDGVLTNPPFKSNLPEKLILRCLQEHGYNFLGLFCRLTFLESARRFKLFNEYPPTNIYVFSERINCNEKYFDVKNGLGGMVAYAWFIWDYRNEFKTTELKWIKPSDYIGELNNE